jgi:hypothetical protein
MRAIGKGSISSFLKVLFDVSRYFLGFALILSSIALILSVVSGLGGNATLSVPGSFELDSRTYNISSASLGIEKAEVVGVRTNLKFPARRGPFLFANLTLLTVLLALALWVVTQLRHVFRTLRDGRPFVLGNAKRIQRLGIAVILGELVRSGVMYFENYYAMTHFMANGIRFVAPLDLNAAAIIHGLIILVIAEVFRMGSRLEEEQSLTV